jgi:hypothetical protein
VAADILVAGAQREQANDLALQLISEVRLVLFHDLWFKVPARSRGVLSSNSPAGLFMVLALLPFLRLGVVSVARCSCS